MVRRQTNFARSEMVDSYDAAVVIDVACYRCDQTTKRNNCSIRLALAAHGCDMLQMTNHWWFWVGIFALLDDTDFCSACDVTDHLTA